MKPDPNRTVVVVADPDAEDRRRVATIVGEVASTTGLSLALYEAETGEQARDLIKKYKPRLVLSEVLLEGLTGLQLVRVAPELVHGPMPGWIFVTHMTTETDRYWALRNGAHGYVKKPFEDDLLRGKVKKMLTDAGKPRAEKPA